MANKFKHSRATKNREGVFGQKSQTEPKFSCSVVYLNYIISMRKKSPYALEAEFKRQQ